MAQIIHILTGPTASGKKDVSIIFAKHIGAEIISMDSIKVFKGMDIGTAKPREKSPGGIAYHLIDIVSPDEDFNVGKYVELAQRKIAEIHARGKRVLFAGGAPLYLKAITQGLFEGPPADWEFRRQMKELEKEKGPGFLHEKLKAVDERTAARLHPNDTKRILRALEVYEKTGRPISDWQRQFGRMRKEYRFAIFGLRWDRSKLYERIEKRIDRMFEDGLVNEVRGLIGRYNLGRQAREAVGYREVAAHLGGQLSLEETIEMVKKDTRNLAKRQLTWFRSMDGIIWIDVKEGESAEEIFARIAKHL